MMYVSMFATELALSSRFQASNKFSQTLGCGALDSGDTTAVQCLRTKSAAEIVSLFRSKPVCGSSGILVFYRCDFALFETKRRDQAMWGQWPGWRAPHRLGPLFGLEKCEITALACDSNCLENQDT